MDASHVPIRCKPSTCIESALAETTHRTTVLFSGTSPTHGMGADTIFRRENLHNSHEGTNYNAHNVSAICDTTRYPCAIAAAATMAITITPRSLY